MTSVQIQFFFKLVWKKAVSKIKNKYSYILNFIKIFFIALNMIPLIDIK